MDNLYDMVVAENIRLNQDINNMTATLKAIQALVEMIKSTDCSPMVKQLSQNCLDLIDQH
jgi:hypothetical protein